MKFLLITSFLLFSHCLQAKLFSGTLDSDDRSAMTRRIGHSSSVKLLSDPYPLGGYEGLEYGLVLESLPTTDFRDYGDGTASGNTLFYPVISIGKGLYNNLDVFVNFSAYSSKSNVGSYGGMLRWSFYESERIPLVVAASIYASSSNYNNEITGDTEGLVIDAGLNFTNTGVYFGVGRVSSSSVFSLDLTDTTSEEKASASDLHLKLGGVVHFRPYFFALEVNRYTTTHFSAKLGIRY